MSKKEENPRPPGPGEYHERHKSNVPDIPRIPPPPPLKRIIREDVSFFRANAAKAFVGIPDEAFDVAIRKVRICVISQKKMIYDIKLNGTYIPADGIVMLSSGIPDMYGKEIYELDRLVFACGYAKKGAHDDVVKIVAGCFSVNGFPLYNYSVRAFKVIGNVFE